MYTEALLLIFGLEILLVLSYLLFLLWKVKVSSITGSADALRHVQWYRVRVITFMYLGAVLFVLLNFLQSL